MGGSVRKLGPDKAQVEYRLTSQSGCDTEIALTQQANDEQLQQRLSSGERPLEWVGSGLSEFGIAAGTRLTTVEDLDRIRAIMDGRDPHTQARLIEAKLAVHPDAKLRARELVEAVRQVTEAAHMSPTELLGSTTLIDRFEQLERGLEREGEAHYAPLADMAPIAKAAGIDPSMLWPQADLERAQANSDQRVRVGHPHAQRQPCATGCCLPWVSGVLSACPFVRLWGVPALGAGAPRPIAANPWWAVPDDRGGMPHLSRVLREGFAPTAEPNNQTSVKTPKNDSVRALS